MPQIKGGKLMVRKPSNKMRPNPPALMVAEPKESRSFSLDLSLGTLENIVVKNGQQVKSGDVIATYQNATIADQANEQAQSLNKLNLAITNAKTNLDSAVQKRNQLANQLAQAKKSVQCLQAANDPSAIEASQQAYDAQVEVVNQAQQALDNSNLDFSDANAQVEQTRKKVTTSVTAPFYGTFYIDEAGKSSANTPYATIVSPGTIVQATVTEYDYNKLKLGQKVEILPVNDSRKVLGSITNISTLPQSAAEAIKLVPLYPARAILLVVGQLFPIIALQWKLKKKFIMVLVYKFLFI